MRLIIEDLEGATTVVNLGNEDVTIGRKPHNTIQLTEQNVSRNHAKLVFRDDGWLIQDLGSYNGVKVNGVPIATPTLLRESDLIQIGDYHLTLTDDVDRATVDIERPRGAANDHYSSVGGSSVGMGMMSSSSDLPSMSVEDLEPMRRPGQPAPGYAQPQQPAEEKSNKTGLIIGVIGAVAAVIGIVAFLASTAGGDEKAGDKSDKTVASDDAGKQEPAANTTAPASTGGAEPVPQLPPANDSGAVADDGGELVPEAETDIGEIVPEIEDEPEPEIEDEPEPAPKNNTPKNNTPKQPKPSKPKMPPDEALAEARKASLAGNNNKAYSLAKEAYDQNQSGDALNLMGVAACKMGNANKAKAAHRKMTTKDKAMLEKLCGSLGIEL